MLASNQEAFLFLKENKMIPYKKDFIKNHICYVIRNNNKIIAHISYVDEKIETELYTFFYCLMVKKEYRGQGLAKKLIQQVEHSAENALCNIPYVCCHYYNKRQRDYYEKIGYTKLYGNNRQMYKKIN